MTSRRSAARAKEVPARSKGAGTRAKPVVTRPRAVPLRPPVDAAIEALREEVAALSRAVATQAEAIERGGLPSPAGDGADDRLRGPLSDAADRMAAARMAIREGLSSLPRDRAYAEAADHLRELATVSPSLMEWLRHLPALSLPLGDAVASLDQAARELEAAEQAARRALEGEP